MSNRKQLLKAESIAIRRLLQDFDNQTEKQKTADNSKEAQFDKESLQVDKVEEKQAQKFSEVDFDQQQQAQEDKFQMTTIKLNKTGTDTDTQFSNVKESQINKDNEEQNEDSKKKLSLDQGSEAVIHNDRKGQINNLDYDFDKTSSEKNKTSTDKSIGDSSLNGTKNQLQKDNNSLSDSKQNYSQDSDNKFENQNKTKVGQTVAIANQQDDSQTVSNEQLMEFLNKHQIDKAEFLQKTQYKGDYTQSELNQYLKENKQQDLEKNNDSEANFDKSSTKTQNDSQTQNTDISSKENTDILKDFIQSISGDKALLNQLRQNESQVGQLFNNFLEQKGLDSSKYEEQRQAINSHFGVSSAESNSLQSKYNTTAQAYKENTGQNLEGGETELDQRVKEKDAENEAAFQKYVNQTTASQRNRTKGAQAAQQEENQDLSLIKWQNNTVVSNVGKSNNQTLAEKNVNQTYLQAQLQNDQTRNTTQALEYLKEKAAQNQTENYQNVTVRPQNFNLTESRMNLTATERPYVQYNSSDKYSMQEYVDQDFIDKVLKKGQQGNQNASTVFKKSDPNVQSDKKVYMGNDTATLGQFNTTQLQDIYLGQENRQATSPQ